MESRRRSLLTNDGGGPDSADGASANGSDTGAVAPLALTSLDSGKEARQRNELVKSHLDA